MENIPCTCGKNTTKTVFACSGAADLGRVSDLVARKLQKDNIRQMKCLAFIGAGIDEMISKVKDTNILVIDGCELDCGKLTMEKNGLTDYHHLRLTDLGYIKGQTPVKAGTIHEITRKVVSLS